jgi:archaeal chaperonin
MSALLEGAVQLVDRGLHPATIVKGYEQALARALGELREIAEPVSADSEEWLAKVAATCIQTKLVAEGAKNLPRLLASAVIQAAEKQGDGYKLDTSRITVRRMPGGGLADSRLIPGVVLPKDLIDPSMPKRLENAKIAVGDVSLVLKKTVADAKLTMTDPKMVGKIGEHRRADLKKIGDRIIATGADVVINREGIDDLVANQFANAGMMAMRHAKIGDIANLAKATGATIVDAKHDITSDDLGFAALVEERKVEGANPSDRWLFVEGCKNPKALTLLLRGGNWYVVDEAERSVNDALMALKNLVERPAILAGGGATEAEISARVMKWSETLQGREQIAVQAFASALEEIPQSLALNAGMHPIDSMVEVRTRHARGGKWFGIDPMERKVKDMYSNEVFEPLAVKEEVLKAATDTACMILRIDAVFDKAPPRAYRMRSEMPEEEKKSRSRQNEELDERAEKFDPTKPVDRRYPL